MGVDVVGANVHDSRLVTSTLENSAVERPKPTPENPQNLCLDGAYVGKRVDEEVRKHGFEPHVRPGGTEPELGEDELKHPARRWVSERTIAWLKGFRALRTRYTVYGDNFKGLVRLACAFILTRMTITREPP